MPLGEIPDSTVLVLRHAIAKHVVVEHRRLTRSMLQITELVEIGALHEIAGGRRTRRYATTQALEAFAVGRG